jgi:HD superfamily phosphohydrolase
LGAMMSQHITCGYHSGVSLGDVIGGQDWKSSVDDLLEVFNATETSPFRKRVLRSLISGPLDCDKLDYVRRDSTHLGAPFAASLDADRLIRNLTLVYGAKGQENQVARELLPGEKLSVAEIGVTEK